MTWERMQRFIELYIPNVRALVPILIGRSTA
jgi:hypothetical protein